VSRFAPLVRNSLENPLIPISSQEVVKYINGGGHTNAGPFVNEQKSLTIAAVWRAVNLIAGTIAALPIHAYRADGDSRVMVTSGRAATLLANPHPDMTQFELMELITTHVLLWGNAYLFLSFNMKNQPTLIPLHPSRVWPKRTEAGDKVYTIDGMPGEFVDADMRGTNDRARVFHIPGFGYDGLRGLSAIQAARQGLGLALAAEEFGARLFANGALSTGIVTTEGSLNEKQMKALSAEWKQKRSGLDKAFDTIFLDGGLKYQQLTIPPEDAQFLETRAFQIDEIARWFGVPPHMLMDVDKTTSWGSGIEQQGIGFLVYTLRSWLTRFEQRFTKLITPEPVYARFSVEGLLRGDSAARGAFYKQMWDMGVFSTNDIRRFEELPPVDGGDVRYRPLNMGGLGTTDGTPATPPEGA